MNKSVLFGTVLALGFAAFMAPVIGLASHLGVDHIQAGKAIYEGTCIACHGPKGKGIMPGIPDFTKKGSPLAQSDAVLFDHIKNGFESPGSFMPMPPLGGNPDLSDDDIQYVVEYLRAEFAK